MDENSQFNLEIRIVDSKSRGRWYCLDKVVDADFTNFRDLINEIVDKFPPYYGDLVKLFYTCMDTKSHIPVCCDQDLVEMFGKHKASKCCPQESSRKQLLVTQSLVLLCPLLLQGWSSHTMRQWPMLPTRQGRENHLQKQVSQKRRGQQPLLQQVLPIPGLPGVGLICSCFSLLCPLQSPHRYMFLTLYTRSVTGSNDPLPVQVVYPAPLLRDIGCPEVIEQTVHTPRKKCAVKKKLTPRRAPVVVPSPSSPASNTRSKKQLQLE